MYCGVCGKRVSVSSIREGSYYTEYKLSCGHVLWVSSLTGHEYREGSKIIRPKYCSQCGRELITVTVNNNTGEIVYYGELDSKQCSYPWYCQHCNRLY